MLVPPCRDGSSVGRLGQSPPLKPTTVSFFNIISYNSENNIRDIRPIFRPLFCHRRVVSIGYLSYPTAAKLLWVDKYYWNRPPPPTSNLTGWIQPCLLDIIITQRLSCYTYLSSNISKCGYKAMSARTGPLSGPLSHLFIFWGRPNTANNEQTTDCLHMNNAQVFYTCCCLQNKLT